jgi:hypothetical protein
VHNSAMNRGTPHRNVHRIATFGVPAVPPFPRTSVRVRTLLRSPPRVLCGKVPKYTEVVNLLHHVSVSTRVLRLRI